MGILASSALRFSAEILTISADVVVDVKAEIEQLTALAEIDNFDELKDELYCYKPGSISVFYSFNEHNEYETMFESMLIGTMVLTTNPATLRCADLLDLQLLFDFRTFMGIAIDDNTRIIGD